MTIYWEESILGIAKGVFAAGALLLIGTISVRAQQVADSATPSIGDSRPLLNQRGVVSAFDAAIDQDPQQASNESQTAVTTDDNNNTIPAMFPHFQNDRIWISGQANFISQWHPAFHSPYSEKKQFVRASARRDFACTDFIYRPPSDFDI